MRQIGILAASGLLTAASVPSTPDLGKAEGKCRPDEPGPAFLVDIVGLKDRSGLLKLEVYPPGENDFLADDNVLVGAGKTFRRVELPAPASGSVQMCVRLPGPGTYALALLHDRDANHRFSLSVDGVGFSRNPKIGWSKPRASAVAIPAGAGLTHVSITLNYRSGLASMRPIGAQ